jgi:hypothetical protein
MMKNTEERHGLALVILSYENNSFFYSIMLLLVNDRSQCNSFLFNLDI